MKLYLASGSPRRAQILRDAHIPFEKIAAPVDEAGRVGEPAVERVLRLAQAKAGAGVEAARRGTGALEGLVIGADTEVVMDGEVLGK